MNVLHPYSRSRVVGKECVHKIAGTTTHYWMYEPEQLESDAITLIAIHGFRGDHHGLEPLFMHLEGYRVIAPDVPGFGKSPRFGEENHDIQGYSRWLREFVTTVVPSEWSGRKILLGHSFGTVIASAAVADGLNVDALALINPIGAPALAGPRAVFTRLAVMYYWLAAALPHKLGTALLRSKMLVRVMSVVMTKTKNRILRRFIHDQHDRYFSVFADRHVVRQAFTASVTSDVTDFASRISCPTLLIAAEKDDITTVTAQKRLSTLFPSAQLHIISETGHLTHYEAPDEAAQILNNFLR